jgi:hypothetical protein
MRKQVFLMWLGVAVCLVAALPAVTAASAAALSFAPPVHYGLGGKPADLASADLNGDGRPDLVASAGAGLEVLLGGDLGRFAPARRTPLGHRALAIAVADFDRDGKQDVVTANADDTVSVLRGDGKGTFVASGTFPTGKSPSDVVVGDLTGDGVNDVATADAGGDGLSILRGDGAGALLPPLDLPVGEACARLVAGDFDLDGHLDLAFSRFVWDEYGGFGVLLGDGAGGFSPPAAYEINADNGLYGLAVADLNGDRKPDLATMDGSEGWVDIGAYLGSGMGGFVDACTTTVSRNLEASGLAAGDLNRDGRDDVVTTGHSPGYVTSSSGRSVTVPPGPPRIYLLLSHSHDGVFFETTSFRAGRLAGEVIVADLNRDGRLDLATTDVEAKSLSVRMNGQPPVLTGLSPGQGRLGALITLTGRHFGKRGAVRFGGETAGATVSWSASKIKVRVPRGTAKGPVKVTVTTLVGRSSGKPFLRL